MSAVWLLEWQFKGPNYWLPGHHTNFTTDAAQAVHFADRRSAEIVRKDLGLVECKVEEHEFVEATAQDTSGIQVNLKEFTSPQHVARKVREAILLAENTRLRAALEWFTVEANWERSRDNHGSPAEYQGQKRAKQALSGEAVSDD